MNGTELRTPVKVHIRWMIRRDMPEVLAIEAASSPYPWAEDRFLGLLRRRDCIGMVAEHGDRVVGFMLYLLRADRLVVLNFAAAPDARRAGVGRQMVAKLAGKLTAHRRTRLTLYARETADAAVRFFRSQGFRATGVVREHYPDSGEDAYRMEYALDSSPPRGTCDADCP